MKITGIDRAYKKLVGLIVIDVILRALERPRTNAMGAVSLGRRGRGSGHPHRTVEMSSYIFFFGRAKKCSSVKKNIARVIESKH